MSYEEGEGEGEGEIVQTRHSVRHVRVSTQKESHELTSRSEPFNAVCGRYPFSDAVSEVFRRIWNCHSMKYTTTDSTNWVLALPSIYPDILRADDLPPWFQPRPFLPPGGPQRRKERLAWLRHGWSDTVPGTGGPDETRICCFTEAKGGSHGRHGFYFHFHGQCH